MGTLPVIAMALVADAVLGSLARATDAAGPGLAAGAGGEPAVIRFEGAGRSYGSRKGRQGPRPRGKGA